MCEYLVSIFLPILFNENGTFEVVNCEMVFFAAGTYIVSEDQIYLIQDKQPIELYGRFESL